MTGGWLYRRREGGVPYALLRRTEDFGVEELDLLRPPARFWADSSPPPLAELHLDARRLERVRSPAELLSTLPEGDKWASMSRRSLNRLFAWFLIAEDPQRRLDAQPVATLAHQASLVQHILQAPDLQRVLIADEVGLGKTVEAGLIVRELLEQQPGLRVLYLAPARLARNVRREFERLGLPFRLWVAGGERDGTLKDPRLIASIHRAAHPGHLEAFTNTEQWDVIVVDECHHLSDWSRDGGSPVRKLQLVKRLAARLGEGGRLILMSGTPHQGHGDRFRNLLDLLRRGNESQGALAGRVIYRTKEDVSDWAGQPLFPGRNVRPPVVIDLGDRYREWLEHIYRFYSGDSSRSAVSEEARRAAGWRCGQALQWSTSSPQAGLGYLVRQAIRLGWTPDKPVLHRAIASLRPYRGGASAEPVDQLFQRLCREVGLQEEQGEAEDLEDFEEVTGGWNPDARELERLLEEGMLVLQETGSLKWELIYDRILQSAGDEKVVLFAQPIETVTALAGWLARKTGRAPALIIGGQSEAERQQAIDAFWSPTGPQYLVSSKAGGEGLNLQVSRWLVHVDVPWNPMELEQRVGRVHRFMSKRTIQVDTVVVKDSREVDAYRVAREKLRDIARTLVSEERFEALFSRVMSLVPPDELQSIIGEGALSPLDSGEQARIAELVRSGLDRWQDFHSRYAAGGKQVRQLDPGEADWTDLGRFVETHTKAQPESGFSSLSFLFRDGEIVEDGRSAQVYRIDDRLYACGDFGGMPVTSPDGRKADLLGLNVAVVARTLREIGLPQEEAGAAHVRWPSDFPPPLGVAPPFGVVVAVRQTVRWLEGTYTELGTRMQCWLVGRTGKTQSVEGPAKGELIRGLLTSTVRMQPEQDQALDAALVAAERDCCFELKRPTEGEREHRLLSTAVPLLVAVVSR